MAIALERCTGLDLPRIALLDTGARSAALALLRRNPRSNLVLIDLVRRLDGPVEVLGAWQRGHLVGVASMRPVVAMSAGVGGVALPALCGAVARLRGGFVRGEEAQVESLWLELEAAGRRCVLDRREGALLLRPNAFSPPSAGDAPAGGGAGLRFRPARPDDLDALLEAARAGLREEGRLEPPPWETLAFRRWLLDRLPRALVAERERRVVFVAYADVRLPEGWLLQGVYTWPEERRRGTATAGVGALCAQAFERGAEHVQLSVVRGNSNAAGLYAKLGFQPLMGLRTLLFEDDNGPPPLAARPARWTASRGARAPRR